MSRIYCALPWYSMHFHSDGSFGSCCHLTFSNNSIPTTYSELMALWNSDNLIQLRKRLISGDTKDTKCSSCYDRFFTTDHDIFGMVHDLPRYSKHDEAFNKYYSEMNKQYKDGALHLELPPLEFYIFTSELCNLKCKMCRQNKDFNEFPVDTIESLVHEIGWEKIDRFGWVGGETLLTKDALNLLDFVSNEDVKGTCIYITTNGILIDRYIDAIHKIDNLFLTVSIDGKEDIYENIRVNAKWDKLKQNLDLIKSYKKNHPNWRINFNSIVMKSTLHLLKDMIDLAKFYEATIFFAPINGGHPEEDFFLNPSILDNVNDFYTIVDEAIKYADNQSSFKAKDSLEKLKILMNTRKNFIKNHSLKNKLNIAIAKIFWQYLNKKRLGLSMRAFRKLLKIIGITFD